MRVALIRVDVESLAAETRVTGQVGLRLHAVLRALDTGTVLT